jgi:threonyl-tRNA synthetase
MPAAEIRLTLPDGSVKVFAGTTTGQEVAASIGAGLAKAALAIELDGQQQDLSEPIAHDAKIKILTAKDPAGLEIARHTLAAQVLARAVKELYPSAALAIGPTVENGFYYDIAFSTPLSSEDLPKIEARMREIIKEGHKIQRELWEPAQLSAHFQATKDRFKPLIIESAQQKNQCIDGKVSAYRQMGSKISGYQNDEFIDLCRGPHVPSLDKITLAFKLTNLAGAYWQGNSQNEQLTRIYGVAFATEKELDAYLKQREEAEKRDHRKLGRELGLFHLQEEAPGQPFWHPKGWSVFLELERYIRENLRRYDYVEVNTPKLVSKKLYEASGHWQNYRENLFLACDEVLQPIVEPAQYVKEQQTSLGTLAGQLENLDILALKPMNCPCHVQIFNQGIKSYRDLPLRMAEFGSCMRNEAKGALHGLMRVTSLTQDDAHIFCTPEQMESEIITLCRLIEEVYRPLGFTDYFVLLATRPEKRVGEEHLWDAAEKALEDACAKQKIPLTLAPGEGAFYGPKLEFHLRDAIGRSWQCGTVQVDFNLPRRLNAYYTNEQGERVPCVMIHRAILGTLERFMGIYIEQVEGKFPVWLSPTHVMIIPITDTQNDYAEQVCQQLLKAPVVTASGGLRVEVDMASERMQKKILLAQQQKIPYMLVVGKKEAEDGTVSVRRRDGTDLGAMPIEQFITRIQREIDARRDAA